MKIIVLIIIILLLLSLLSENNRTMWQILFLSFYPGKSKYSEEELELLVQEFSKDSFIIEHLGNEEYYAELSIRAGCGCSYKEAKEILNRIKRDRRENKAVNSLYSGKLSDIDRMDGIEFEYFVADLMRKLGYKNVEVTKGSNDQGADVIATKDNIRYAIQCKRYNQLLNNKPIQEITVGRAYYKCDVGVVLTNNYFNNNAKQAASATGILLWDRTKLIEMIEQANM